MHKVQTLADMQGFLHFGNYPELGGWSAEELFAALELQRAETEGADLLAPEWNAFLNPVPAGAVEFETHLADVPPGLRPQLGQIVLVSRLREVRALRGFTRIEEPDVSDPTGPRVVPLSGSRLDWLPAVEVRGEGIFLRFDEARITSWEARTATKQWSSEAARAFAHWRRMRELPVADFPGARYVLLHSISHLLIRQLGLDCGYTAGSIRERLYCSPSSAPTPMAGLLLYTSTTDSDGSLGGLVELGEERNFGPLFQQALVEASYCASDPLCADTRPGTNDSPNGAACHACLLASETSCENNNRLLDRSLVRATVSEDSIAFFDG